MGDTTIYILKCPVSGEIKYVGQTNRPFNERLKQHINSPLPNTREWIGRLKEEGKSPIILPIQTGVPNYLAAQTEMEWVRFYKERGCALLNKKDSLSFKQLEENLKISFLLKCGAKNSLSDSDWQEFKRELFRLNGFLKSDN